MMTPEDAKAFVRGRFEDFVNRQDLAVDYQERGVDVTPGLPSGPPAPGNISQRPSADFRVSTSASKTSSPKAPE